MSSRDLPTLGILLSGLIAAVSAACGGEIPDQPQPGESHVVTIPVDDPNLGEVERTFRLYLPLTYTDVEEIPLVMNFHGYGAEGTDWIGLHDTSDQVGYLAGKPQDQRCRNPLVWAGPSLK